MSILSDIFIMTFQNLLLDVTVQTRNSSASMFHTRTVKSFLAKVEGVGGFQLRNVSRNQNVKHLLIQSADNVICGDAMMVLLPAQQTLVEPTLVVSVTNNAI